MRYPPGRVDAVSSYFRYFPGVLMGPSPVISLRHKEGPTNEVSGKIPYDTATCAKHMLEAWKTPLQVYLRKGVFVFMCSPKSAGN